MNRTYEVKLESFEGPLDLLLHLVNDLEIDIYDIPVAKITDQYMEYIKAMQQIELNIASEYLVMAATLLQIKSAMLLPKKEVEYEDEYEEDPREALIDRLLEYQKYKQAAEMLKEKELSEIQLYTRPPILFEELKEQTHNIRGDIPIYAMLEALTDIYKRKRWNEPQEAHISRIEVSIEQRMKEILELLETKKNPVTFLNLFPYPKKTHIVTTFLAVLQLLKNNLIECYQEKHFQPIYIKRMEVHE